MIQIWQAGPPYLVDVKYPGCRTRGFEVRAKSVREVVMCIHHELGVEHGKVPPTFCPFCPLCRRERVIADKKLKKGKKR